MTEPSSPFAVARYLRAVVGTNQDGPTDAELLARFAANRDQGAFELLVWRHAGMVTTVCRNILRDHHAAEDATQAAFLALARKAGTVRENPAGWLFRVASRIAIRSRKSVTPLPRTVAEIQQADREDNSILHEELARLPEKYRVPILLCFFEGLSHADAAKRLGWPTGTVAGRIARAKDVLQSRLVRRGVTIPAIGLTTLFSTEGISGAFAAATTQAAMAFVSGSTVTGVSASVLPMAKGAIRAMTISKLQTAAGVLFACAALTVGSVWAIGQGPGKAGESGGAGRTPVVINDPSAAGSLPDWWLITNGEKESKAVRLSDSKTIPIPGVMSTKELSPDGKKRFVIDSRQFRIVDGDRKVPFYDLMVEDLTKEENAPNRYKRLTGQDSNRNVRDPAWSPDGKRIAYVNSSALQRMPQVFVVDADGSNLKQLTQEAGKATKPLFLPDGSIAYFVQTEQKGKQTFYDLMIHDGTTAKRLVERTEAFDMAIRPDGKQIAIASASLSIYDSESGKLVSRIPMSDVNKDWPVVFTNLVWRPDGKAIAFKPTFVGGISVGPGQKAEDIRLPGDAHIGMIDFSGEKPTAKTFEVGRGFLPDHWQDGLGASAMGAGTAATGSGDVWHGTIVDRIKVDAKAPTPGKPEDPKRIADYAQRVRSKENLKNLALALLNYESAMGHFPQDIVDEKGKSLLSWRVQLLPYLEQDHIYKRLKLNEPWDSELNKTILMNMPDVFRTGFQDNNVTVTYYQAFTGLGTAFNEPGKKIKMVGIIDGTSNTLGVAEVGPAVPWTKPGDMPYHPGKAFPNVTWPFANVIQFATLDAEIRVVKPDVGELLLRRWIERDDGMNVPELKTFRPTFPAEAAEEKAMLARTLNENAALLAEIDDVMKELAALQKLKNSHITDVEKARDMTLELKRFLEAFKPRIKKERDDMGLRPGAKVPEPKELPKP
jgi:RNA polymerase sigma factor (sigma-70 family)